MLKYTVNYDKSGDNYLEIQYNSFILELNSNLVNNEEYAVTFYCDDDIPLNEGDSIKVTCGYTLFDSLYNETSPQIESFDTKVIKANHIEYNFTIAIPKLTKIPKVASVDVIEEDNLKFWEFHFFDNTTFNPSDEDIAITVNHTGRALVRIEGLIFVDSYTLRWVYDENYPDFDQLYQAVFGQSLHGTIWYRDQFLFKASSEADEYNTSLDLPSLSIVKPKMTIRIPINATEDINLMKEMKINELFVQNGVENSINSISEMEKRVYVPVCKTNNGFRDIIKINFNLHLREHSGDNWTVKENDTWNCIKLKELNEKFMPYSNDSNQSDLLGYLGFNNKDVKYQKNVLKKSFLRLSYYDSTNEGDQHLLAYSTVYFDTAKLYSKYMYTHEMPIYINTDIFNEEEEDYDILTGGRVFNEVNRKALSKYVIIADDETIEKYRISSQISVENKWASKRTSEGYYVYLWADNNVSILPSDLYMKVELNHAGYGRTIPFMFPYDETMHKFKTMDEIASDWEDGGYDINKYKKYSYLKLQYLYDKDNARYVYYLDNKRYGFNDKKIMNINLYEARISF